MKQSVAQLIAAFSEKGTVLKRLETLVQQEQGLLAALDLAGLEQNQQEMAEVMERLARLSDSCKGLMVAIGAELGLADSSTLSPIIARLAPPEQQALSEAQASIAAGSKALGSALTLNQGLLEDSLQVVERSVSFFNRLFNPNDTYGMAGSLVARRGGSRFVCKEA